MRSDTAARECSTIYRQIDTYQSIYGGLAAQWHRGDRVSVTAGKVTSWQDSIALLSLPAAGVPNRPSYAVDGSYWGGQLVPMLTKSGNSGLNSIGSPNALLAAGSRPWTGTAVRFTAAGSAQQFVWWMYNAAVSLELLSLQRDASNTVFSGPTAGATTPRWASDGLPHWHEVFYDATGLKTHAVDGVVVGTYAITTLAQAAAVFSFGSASLSCDCAIGVHLVRASLPSASQRARGMAFAKADLSF
jgi:hypothetical protein